MTPIELSVKVSRADFKFEIPRFWSSPDLVPAITIIAHVINLPCHSDLDQVLDRFGEEAVLSVLDLMKERGEVKQRMEDYCLDHIKNRHPSLKE